MGLLEPILCSSNPRRRGSAVIHKLHSRISERNHIVCCVHFHIYSLDASLDQPNQTLVSEALKIQLTAQDRIWTLGLNQNIVCMIFIYLPSFNLPKVFFSFQFPFFLELMCIFWLLIINFLKYLYFFGGRQNIFSTIFGTKFVVICAGTILKIG